MDMLEKYSKKNRKLKKQMKRIKTLKALYRNRKKFGTVVYSVLYLASGKRQ